MFKKFLVLLLIVGGVLSSNAIKSTKAQEEIQVSPRVWVKDSNAVSEITVHVAWPYSESEGFLFYVDGEQVTPSNAFPDDRGDLVIKFVPVMDLYDVGVGHSIEVYIGEEYWKAIFAVKNFAEPATSKENIVILSGDKVRGEEGQGEVNMIQNTDCNAWDEWCLESEETTQAQPQESATDGSGGGDVVIESGDKVRGDEGDGNVNQNQAVDPNCWDEPWCDSEGSFGE